MSKETKRKTVLIVDDEEINRVILSSMLSGNYDTLEAENGREALEICRARRGEIAIMLLDIIMPAMDGIEVLEAMNQLGYIEEIPVVMISTETGSETMKKAYDLGAVDYIPRSSYSREIILRRIQNTIMLFSKQKQLAAAVADQFHQRQHDNELMVSILSHVVEFRNAESGLHVLHIGILTEMLLEGLLAKTDRYAILRKDIPLIRMASAFHDIGKIAVPESILNKPGRLTPEEFEIVKSHSEKGAEMLEAIEEVQGEAFMRYAIDICRYHHERYDGKGYPTGKSGDDIPIHAQVVALADVYDALTSVRCYKRAFTHEEALAMIANGECGAFNPLLLSVLLESSEAIKKKMSEKDPKAFLAAPGLSRAAFEELSASSGEASRDYRLLLDERRINDIFTGLTDEAWFTFTFGERTTLSFNKAAVERFGLVQYSEHPFDVGSPWGKKNQKAWEIIQREIARSTKDRPAFSFEFPLILHGESRVFHVEGSTLAGFGDGQDLIAVGRIEDATADQRIRKGVLTPFKDTSSGDFLTFGHDFTLAEAKIILETERGNFDLVRLVSEEFGTEAIIGDDLTLRQGESEDSYWDKGQNLECNSLSQTDREKGKSTHFRVHGSNLYFVISRKILIEGEPYVLELLSRIDENALASFEKDDNLLYAVASFSRKLYRDSTLDCRTRRYYDDKVKDRVGSYCVALLDMDNFKSINDTVGHESGDIALKKAVSAIRSRIRLDDEVIRFGGDEFIIVFPDMDEEIFKKKLESVLEAIHAESVEGISIAASCGGVRGTGSIEGLLRKADKALYQAKKEKGTYRLYGEGENA